MLFLLSLKAAGTGLNLTSANHVVHVDRWWNPAVEDQAINRAHRIGTQGAVTVTRFLSVNTIEQRINEVLEQKRALFDAVFSETMTPASTGLSREEIFALFDLRVPVSGRNAA
jgi:SNF2 family DNA or RNA helicase